MANITDFIHINAAGLAELVNQRLRPLHDPARDELHPGIARLLRSPKGPQGHLITGAVKALKRQKDIVWAMSMGTGKSYCSIATTHCMAEGKPYTAIVVCPPHLVGKWEREVEATVKGPRVIQVRDWTEWLFISRLQKDQIIQPTWIITPISTAKLGGRWQPAAVTPHCLGASPLCPQCFAPVIGEKKEPATHDWLSASKRFCPHCRSPLFGYQGQHYYEGSKLVKKHMRWLKPTLVIDECFVSGTLVKMDLHLAKAIDKIIPGDFVLSWDGDRYVRRKVTRTIKSSRRRELVRVRHSGGEFVCTDSHKIRVTGSGWVAAKDLQVNDILIGVPMVQGQVRCREAVRKVLHEEMRKGLEGQESARKRADKELQEVRAGVQADKAKGCVLREVVFIKGENGRPSVYGEDAEGDSGQGYISRSKGGVVLQHEEAEQQSRSASKDGGHDQGEAVRWRARRKWSGFSGGGDVVFGVELRSDCGLYRRVSWCAEPLQARLGQRTTEGFSGSGWQEPLGERGAGERRTEDGILGVNWLEGNQGQERGSPWGHQECRVESVEILSGGPEFVYDLEVDGTHCYFAGNALVSNCHQAKSATTFAGLAMGHLIAAAHKVMLLTGTLIAGKSEDLRPTYFRLFPKRFIEQGLGWKDETEFAKRYGRMETKHTVTTTNPGLATEKVRSSGTTRKVRPGIMPQLFRDFIADRTIFCSLKEMKIALPELKETVTPITMAPEQAAEYHHMSDKLLYQFNRLMHTDRPMAMRYLAPVAEALMTWPDDPCSTWPSIGYKDWDGQFRAIYEPKPIPEQITPKEEELFRIIDQNKAEGRQCWLFSTRIDTTERIRTLASRRNLSCGCLHASVHPIKREQWIAEQAPDLDCIISHPKLIETGIDLFSTTGMGPKARPYNMCTLIWLSTGLELNTLRQASARHWRIGQPLECRTHFLYYRDTAQQHAITLMAKKLLAAEYLEGNMEGGGLMEESGETSMELAIVRQMAAGVSAMVPEYFNAV